MWDSNEVWRFCKSASPAICVSSTHRRRHNATSVPAQRWHVDWSELRKAYNKSHIIYFFALNCTLYNPHCLPVHLRTLQSWLQTSRAGLASGNSPFAPTGSGHLRWNTTVCSPVECQGRDLFWGARSIKSLARRWAPAIRISLAVKDNVVILEASPGVSPLFVYTLLVN